MKILIMACAVVKNDAIGNDVACMVSALKGNCVVYAEHLHFDELPAVNVESVRQILSDKDNVVIFHHSIFWQQGESLIEGAKAKIFFKYHNITPPEFFKDYCDRSAYLCDMGRHQTKRLEESFPGAHWLCDSGYNASDLQAKTIKSILPPFNLIEDLESVPVSQKKYFEIKTSGRIDLLFVGRLAPNKGHLFLMEMLSEYISNYDNKIRLHLVGKCYTPAYLLLLRAHIYKYQLQDFVAIDGEMDAEMIKTYYQACDFFVCASEHEGFCVPIIEAQYFGQPIIARDSSAIRETLGDQQVCFSGTPKEFATAIRSLASRKDRLDQLISMGRANFDSRFRQQTLQNKFLEFLSVQ